MAPKKKSKPAPVQTYLRDMIKSGDAQAVLVGEFLNDQLNQGEDLEFLLVCAEEIRDAASFFIEQYS